MAFQLWLADVLRGAGLTVHEVAGWRTRSAAEDRDASTYRPRGVIIHETRGSATSSDAGEIGVLVNGRVGLSGPIAQLYLGRNGHWHVVAAGMCHHVKTGWGGPFKGLGNSRLLGIEPAHSVAEDWARKPIQYESYVRGVAAILRHTGWPAPVGHKEHQPGDKPDPEFNMDRFRLDVVRAMHPVVPPPPAPAKPKPKSIMSIVMKESAMLAAFIRFSDQPDAAEPQQSVPDIFARYDNGLVRGALPDEWSHRNPAVPVHWEGTAAVATYRSYDLAQRDLDLDTDD